MTRIVILFPIALAGMAYAAAQSLATHDWLVAVPLLVLLAVGLVLIAPGDETPAASEASPRPASASHPQREEAALGKRRTPWTR